MAEIDPKVGDPVAMRGARTTSLAAWVIAKASDAVNGVRSAVRPADARPSPPLPPVAPGGVIPAANARRFGALGPPADPTLVGGNPAAGASYSHPIPGTAFTAMRREPWFGPGSAPVPTAPKADVAGRAFDYMPGVNMGGKPRQWAGTSFEQLRGMADALDIVRLCIETRKDQMGRLTWSVLPKQSAGEVKRAKADDRCRAVEDFLRRPDRKHSWDAWLRMIIEDNLVIDAVSIYVRRTLGGGVHSLEVVDGTCYASDMQVMTRRGWITFDEVNLETDEFATRRLGTGEFEWQKATHYHEAEYDGPMYRFHSRQVDLLVSPNHRMLVNGLPRSLGGSRHRKGEAVVKASDLAGNISGKTAIPMTSVWAGSEIDQVAFPATGRTSSIATVMSGDDYCAFMGMWLAEGSLRKDGKSIAVTQGEKSRGYQAYQELLERIFGNWCRAGGSFLCSRAGVHRFLRQFGGALEKFIPEDIMNATPRQIAIFWEHFRLGDGAADRDRLFTSSRRMADQLVELAQKLGVSASVNPRKRLKDAVINGQVIPAENCAVNYCVSVRRSKEMRFSASVEQYSGRIACVSVPNEFLYVRRNGKPAWCGNTIKPLLDTTGRTPDPPEVAYQQVLKGMPAVDYTSDELLYAPRNVRSHHIYALSVVEQIVMTVNIAIRREIVKLNYFTENNIPEALVSVPKEWQPDMIQRFQVMWDALLKAQQNRAGLKFVPGDMTFQPTRSDGMLQGPFDEWLARVVCFAFSLPPTAFVQQMNRATAEQASETALEEGLAPMMGWLKTLMDRIVQDVFGYADLEFTFDDNKQIDLAEERSQELADIQSGVMSIDEVRAKRGLDPLGMGNTIPGGPNGLIFLSDLVEAFNAGLTKIQPPPPPPPTDQFGNPLPPQLRSSAPSELDELGNPVPPALPPPAGSAATTGAVPQLAAPTQAGMPATDASSVPAGPQDNNRRAGANPLDGIPDSILAAVGLGPQGAAGRTQDIMRSDEIETDPEVAHVGHPQVLATLRHAEALHKRAATGRSHP